VALLGEPPGEVNGDRGLPHPAFGIGNNYYHDTTSITILTSWQAGRQAGWLAVTLRPKASGCQAS
jgi:hypothetical protein